MGQEAGERFQLHRSTALERLPSESGVEIIVKFSEGFKSLFHTQRFKTRLKHFLVSKTFYSVEDFITCRWEQ